MNYELRIKDESRKEERGRGVNHNSLFLIHNSRSFSLIEVLVAMLVVSIAAVSFGALMVASVKGVSKLDKYAAANFLAIDEIEKVRQIRDSSYLFYLRDPASRAAYKNPLNAIGNAVGAPLVLNGISYVTTRTVACLARDASNNCMKLQLAVSVSADGQNAISAVDYLYDYLPPAETF